MTILQQLKRHETDIHKKGVKHIAVIGSYAREKARAESDIDILIELNPNFTMDLYSYAGLKNILPTFLINLWTLFKKRF